MHLAFVETPLFTSTARGLIDDGELTALQDVLLRDPWAGALVAGAGGVRKIRVAARGKGKRGGARVIYHFSQQSDTIYLLLAYSKNRAEDLSPAGRRYMKRIVESFGSGAP